MFSLRQVAIRAEWLYVLIRMLWYQDERVVCDTAANFHKPGQIKSSEAETQVAPFMRPVISSFTLPLAEQDPLNPPRPGSRGGGDPRLSKLEREIKDVDDCIWRGEQHIAHAEDAIRTAQLQIERFEAQIANAKAQIDNWREQTATWSARIVESRQARTRLIAEQESIQGLRRSKKNSMMEVKGPSLTTQINYSDANVQASIGASMPNRPSEAFSPRLFGNNKTLSSLSATSQFFEYVDNRPALNSLLHTGLFEANERYSHHTIPKPGVHKEPSIATPRSDLVYLDESLPSTSQPMGENQIPLHHATSGSLTQDKGKRRATTPTNDLFSDDDSGYMRIGGHWDSENGDILTFDADMEKSLALFDDDKDDETPHTDEEERFFSSLDEDPFMVRQTPPILATKPKADLSREWEDAQSMPSNSESPCDFLRDQADRQTHNTFEDDDGSHTTSSISMRIDYTRQFEWTRRMKSCLNKVFKIDEFRLCQEG
jgi:hypothetical protein